MSVKRASRSILLIALPLSLGASTHDLFDVNDPATSPQSWDLTNSAGQVASVVVSPFTNSGTFGEVEGSAGWWISMPGCAPYRLQVGGNIVHAGQADRWSFVGLTGAGCNSQTLGSGEGYANGNFPGATQVTNGTLTLTTQTPGGSNTASATWTAQRR
jgi:hypothetical protein